MPKNIRLNSRHYFIKKIPNLQEFEQLASNHSLDIDFKEFMNFYKNSAPKRYSVLVIDVTPASDNSLCFGKNVSERIQKLIMRIDAKIRDKKLQYDVIRQAAKISGLY